MGHLSLLIFQVSRSQRALPAQLMGWQVLTWPRLLEEVMFENGLESGWELAGGGGGDGKRHPSLRKAHTKAQRHE